jgi:hypothetical protein
MRHMSRIVARMLGTDVELPEPNARGKVWIPTSPTR